MHNPLLIASTMGKNPDKTQQGELISSYLCDPETAGAEFMLSKAKYKAITGREQKKDADILCYQIRQSFVPGEITPEEADRICLENGLSYIAHPKQKSKGKYKHYGQGLVIISRRHFRSG